MAEAAGDIAGPINAETGDTSQFGSIVTTGGMTFDAHADGAHHGSYGFRSIGNGAGINAYGIVTFTDKTSLYARCYFEVDSTIEVAQYGASSILIIMDGATILVRFVARRNAAGTGAIDQYAIAGQDLTSVYKTMPTMDQPHCIELYWTAGDGDDGGSTAWLDGDYGTPVQSELNNDLTAYAADRVWMGSYGVAVPDGKHIYTDDLIVNTSQIGVYSEAAGSIIPLLSQYYRRLRV